MGLPYPTDRTEHIKNTRDFKLKEFTEDYQEAIANLRKKILTHLDLLNEARDKKTKEKPEEQSRISQLEEISIQF